MRAVQSAAIAVLLGISLLVLSTAGWAQTQDPAQSAVNDHPPKPPDLGPNSPDQSAAANQSSTEIPDYVLFHFFFVHLENLEAVAASEEAKGAKDADKWRTHEQRAAQLTQAEGRSLNQVAHLCNQAVKEQETKIRAALKSWRDNNISANAVSTPPSELAQLFDERQHIISSYISELKAQLGEDSFEKLSAYILANFKVTTTAPPASSPATSSVTQPVGGAQ